MTQQLHYKGHTFIRTIHNNHIEIIDPSHYVSIFKDVYTKEKLTTMRHVMNDWIKEVYA